MYVDLGKYHLQDGNSPFLSSQEANCSKINKVDQAIW